MSQEIPHTHWWGGHRGLTIGGLLVATSGIVLLVLTISGLRVWCLCSATDAPPCPPAGASSALQGTPTCSRRPDWSCSPCCSCGATTQAPSASIPPDLTPSPPRHGLRTWPKPAALMTRTSVHVAPSQRRRRRAGLARRPAPPRAGRSVVDLHGLALPGNTAPLRPGTGRRRSACRSQHREDRDRTCPPPGAGHSDRSAPSRPSRRPAQVPYVARSHITRRTETGPLVADNPQGGAQSDSYGTGMSRRP